MALHLKDCPPELRAKIEAALAEQNPAPKKLYAMATYIQNVWSIGPPTSNYDLVVKLVRQFNLSTPLHARQTFDGMPPAVLVHIEVA